MNFVHVHVRVHEQCLTFFVTVSMLNLYFLLAHVCCGQKVSILTFLAVMSSSRSDNVTQFVLPSVVKKLLNHKHLLYAIQQ